MDGHGLALNVVVRWRRRSRRGQGGTRERADAGRGVDNHGGLRARHRGRLGALGQGQAIGSAAEPSPVIPRPPAIRGVLILGLVLIESLVIYVLAISLILFFLKPFGG
jgi:F0F1-type ATP synthase membrane subunit c/vacuolar-type H+-ATPase subunit K